MQLQTYEALKVSDANCHQIKDAIVVEAALQININNEPYTVVMRTPNDDFFLIRGLLFAEDIYKHQYPLTFEIVETQQNIPSIINVSIDAKFLGKGYLNKRTLLSVSSCGICGKTQLEDLANQSIKIKSSIKIDAQKIENLFIQMQEQQQIFKQTGGSHAAAVFDVNYRLLSIKEDIGRHNALDKVIGELLENNLLSNGKILTVSGRVSYEIVSKAFFANIPVIIAISACSSLAIDFAKEFGICLIGFSRKNQLTIYANTHMIQIDSYAE